MPTTAGSEFTSVQTFDGSTYTDVTLESQSPAGTAFSVLGATNHWLYLGHDSRFDMAIFDVDTTGSLGALSWYYHNGSTWVQFTPMSARYEIDLDDNEGTAYDFSKDGIEQFPMNILNSWATTAVNSVTKYWIRVSTASVSQAPTIKRMQMRALAAYCTPQDVFDLLQLVNVTGTTNFTSATVPSLDMVEQNILEAQSYIDSYTRKSWRPNYIAAEYHQFNINGIRLDYTFPYKILALKVWNGSSWDTKVQGRSQDFFLVPDTSMVQFARYFALPAKFTTYNAPIWRWGGGEFSNAVKISYLAGRDINMDIRQGTLISDICTKIASIEVVRQADFGGAVVNGLDRISLQERVSGWEEETSNNLDNLKAFEVF